MKNKNFAKLSINNKTYNLPIYKASEGNDVIDIAKLFSVSGHFTYDLKEEVSVVKIKVFSLAGRLIDELEGQIREGQNQVEWIPAADLANGTYLYKIAVERKNGSAGGRTAVLHVVK